MSDVGASDDRGRAASALPTPLPASASTPSDLSASVATPPVATPTVSLGPIPSPRRHGLIGSFRFAIAGIAHLFRTQRNARIHLTVGIVACGLAAWLRISRAEWGVLILTVASVLILEGVNTALEAVVDLASPQIHPLAKTAKDVSAGMVLIAAIASVGVGLAILGPPLWHRLLTAS